jgi:hypothetical protein
MEAERVDDDLGGERGSVWAPLPQRIADDLRLHLDANADNHAPAREEA